MSMINPSFFETHKRKIAYTALAGVAILFVLWLVAYQDSCSFRRDIEADKSEIKKAEVDLQKLRDEASQLRFEIAKKEAEIDRMKADLQKAQKDLEDAKSETNRALDNADAIRNANYDGSNINSARCRAYPESCR